MAARLEFTLTFAFLQKMKNRPVCTCDRKLWLGRKCFLYPKLKGKSSGFGMLFHII